LQVLGQHDAEDLLGDVAERPGTGLAPEHQASQLHAVDQIDWPPA
jgi:hypothetical protein